MSLALPNSKPELQLPYSYTQMFPSSPKSSILIANVIVDSIRNKPHCLVDNQLALNIIWSSYYYRQNWRNRQQWGTEIITEAAQLQNSKSIEGTSNIEGTITWYQDGLYKERHSLHWISRSIRAIMYPPKNSCTNMKFVSPKLCTPPKNLSTQMKYHR